MPFRNQRGDKTSKEKRIHSLYMLRLLLPSVLAAELSSRKREDRTMWHPFFCHLGNTVFAFFNFKLSSVTRQNEVKKTPCNSLKWNLVIEFQRILIERMWGCVTVWNLLENKHEQHTGAWTESRFQKKFDWKKTHDCHLRTRRVSLLREEEGEKRKTIEKN